MDTCVGLIPSNTFNSANFDVLKIDGIADPLISVNKMATMDIEESYFLSTIEFIKESNRSYYNAKSILYKALAESAGDDIIINESFNDFFGAVHDIISKFLKFIKSLFDRFVNALASLVGSEKYLEKNKKKLDDFRDGDEFSINGYKYTFNPTVPSNSAVISNSNALTYGLDISELDLDTIKGVKDERHDEICDRLRAEILGKEGTIDESDFAEELFKIFRNDELDSDSMDIKSLEVRESKKRFFEYKSTKKEIERQQKEIDKTYKEIEDNVRKFVKDKDKASNLDQFRTSIQVYGTVKTDGLTDGDNGTYAKDFIPAMDIFMKNRADLIQKISNIHALAFSAKLDAIKDCYKQDKAILYKALSMIQRTDSARKK